MTRWRVRVRGPFVLLAAVTIASAGALTAVHDTFWAPGTAAATHPAARQPATTHALVSAVPAPTVPVDPAPAGVVQDPGRGAPGAADVGGRGEASVLPALDAAELAATAQRVGIPERALAAYASAALAVQRERPACGLTWVTLAGIGRIESHHGTIGGGELRDDGTPTRPIIGVPLDGGPDVRALPDTDGGRYDGDARWERAVGPMQFLPSTWARHGVDANGSGEADPQHVDDAALAAARYLCAGGGDLRRGDAWVRAVRGYNRSDAYVHAVLDAADTYADRAEG